MTATDPALPLSEEELRIFVEACDASTHLAGDPETSTDWLIEQLRRSATAALSARAELAEMTQAVGLATTCAPLMEIDVHNPIGMMQTVCAEVARLRRVGSLMSNVLYNLAQRDSLFAHEREQFRELVSQWDAPAPKQQEPKP